MNIKTTIALFILLAIVGGYFYFVEYGNITGYEAHQQQQDARPSQPVGERVFADDALTAEAVDRLDLVRGGRNFTAEKQGNQWYQTQPVRFRLDNQTPELVARQFANLRYVQRIEPGASDSADPAPTAAQMGLEQPRAVITARVGDESWTLKLGRLAVDGNGYAQVEGEDTAYVVAPAIYGTLLDQPTDAWRSRTLGPIEAAGADRITLHPADGERVVLHKRDGTWLFDTDTIQRSSQVAVDELFAAVSRVWITDFIEDSPESLSLYGLDNPHTEIITQSPNLDPANPEKTQTRLKIGRTSLEGDARYAAWTQDSEPNLVVFTIDTATADSLARSADDLRDPRVTTVEAQDVRGLSVTQDGEVTLNFLRDPQSGYRFADPKPAFKIDYSTTHALVRQLCELEATGYTTALNELGAPISTLTLATAAEGDRRLRVYRTGDTHTFVTEGEGVGYVVEASDLVEQLTGAMMNLRQRTVLDVSAEELASLTLTRADGVTYEFIASEIDTGWDLKGHAPFEEASLNSLIASLNPLRAADWLTGPATLSPEAIELNLQQTDGTSATLSVDPTSQQAMLSGSDTGFRLPQPFIDLLTSEYRDRSLRMPDAEQIDTIKLIGDAISVTLSRDGRQFVSDYGEIDPAVAANTYDTLAGLRVIRYTAPLSMRQEDIDFSLDATTRDGDMLTLRFLAGDTPDAVTATIDPEPGGDHSAWFTLRSQDVQALRTALTDLESPTK